MIVAVANLEGDQERAYEQQLLLAIRTRARERAEPLVILDLDIAIRTAHIDDPIAALRHGHEQARALLARTGAIALLWGRLSAETPILYVTTADSERHACPHAPAPAPGDTPDPDATDAKDTPCQLETGATWALCASAWSWLAPACDTP